MILASNKTLIIIFSRDNPMQLEATINSLMLYCQDIHLTQIFISSIATSETTNKQYEELKNHYSDEIYIDFLPETDSNALSIQKIIPYRYVVCLSDDTMFTRDFRITDATSALNQNPKAVGYSLFLGENITFDTSKAIEQKKPPFTSFTPNISLTNWVGSKSPITQTISVNGIIFRSDDLTSLLHQPDFINPDIKINLLDRMKRKFQLSKPQIMCFKESIAYSAQYETVKNVVATPEFFAKMFNQGFSIDILKLTNFVSSKYHQTVIINLKKREKFQRKQPTVSVIIPCYKLAHYLPVAVMSVIKQTYRDWECIIVNDGSPDDSSIVALNLLSQFPDKQIFLLEKENTGVSDTRNYGIRASRGKFILPLDADDFIHPDNLQKLAGFLEDHPEIDIVYPIVQTFGEVQETRLLVDWNVDKLIHQNILPCSSLYRREVWEKVGGYDTSFKLDNEDWNFWISAAERGFVGYRIQEPLFYYRTQASSRHMNSKPYGNYLRALIITKHPNMYDYTSVQKAKIIVEKGIEQSITPAQETSVQKSLQQAEQYFKENRLVEAKDCLYQAINLEPDKPELINSYGNILLRLGDTEGARKEFRKSIILAPQYIPGYVNLACTLVMLNQLDEAKVVIKKAQKIDPNHPDIVNFKFTISGENQTHTEKIQKELITGKAHPSIAFFAGNNNFHFAFPIMSYLRQMGFSVNAFNHDTLSSQSIENILHNSDLVWFEWGLGPVIPISHLPKMVPIICRVHRYEIYQPDIKQVDWEKVDHIVFVNNKYIDVFKQYIDPDIERKTRLSVIPNPIDDKKKLITKEKNYKIAYISHFESAKNPSLMLQVLASLIKRDERYSIHMIGKLVDRQLYDYCMDFVKKQGLDNHFFYEGFIDDVQDWLKDKSYILSTSIVEGHPVGLSEAMMMGLKPVIHNSFGDLDALFPKEYVFNTIDEAVEIILSNEYEPEKYRNAIETKYGSSIVLPQIYALVMQYIHTESQSIVIDTINPSVTVFLMCPQNTNNDEIKYTVDSVLQQTYHDFHITICQWGESSKPENPTIEFTSPRITYQYIKTSNVSEARNQALQSTRSDFVIWLNPGEFLFPNTLSLCICTYNQHPNCNLFYGNILNYDPTNKYRRIIEFSDWYNNEENLWATAILQNPLPDSGYLVKRELYNEKFDEKFEKLTDYAWFVNQITQIKAKHIGELSHQENKNATLALTETDPIHKEYSEIINHLVDKITISKLFPQIDWHTTNHAQATAIAYFEIGKLFLKHHDYKRALTYYKKSKSTAPSREAEEKVVFLENKLLKNTDLGKIKFPNNQTEKTETCFKILFLGLVETKLEQIIRKIDQQVKYARVINPETYGYIIGENLSGISYDKYEHIRYINSNEYPNGNTRPGMFQILKKIVSEVNPDIIYFRYPYFDYWTYDFISAYKNVVFEHQSIAENEFRKPWAETEKKFAPYILAKARGIVAVTKEILQYEQARSLTKLPGYVLTNGIDTDSLPMSETHYIPGQIHLLSVSSFAPWHGINRLLYGMANYPDLTGITLHLIGEGDDKKQCQKIVEENHLENHVIFHGKMTPDEITEITEYCQVAIGSLAIHRNKMKEFCALKHREYCLRGIPFAYAGKDIDFNSDLPFVRIFSSDEKPIDFEVLVDFAKKVVDEPELRQQERQYAMSKLGWDHKIVGLIDFLREVKQHPLPDIPEFKIPEPAEAHIQRIQSALAQNNFNEAEKNSQNAINEYQYQPYIWFLRGYVQLKTNKMKESKQSFQKSIFLDPNHALSYAMLGLLAMNENEYTQAEKYLQQARKIDPTEPNTNQLLKLLNEKMNS